MVSTSSMNNSSLSINHKVSTNSSEAHQMESEKNKIELAFPNFVYGIVLHPAAIYGLYLAFTSANILTVILGEYTVIVVRTYIVKR